MFLCLNNKLPSFVNGFGIHINLLPIIILLLLERLLLCWHFILFFIGFHLTFTTMHIQGLLGMPRRIYTYEPDRGWEIWNTITSSGVVLQGLGVACFVLAIGLAFRQKKPAGADPWDAWTLEWATSSPPPEYNFLTLPVVRSRRPLWDEKHPPPL